MFEQNGRKCTTVKAVTTASASQHHRHGHHQHHLRRCLRSRLTKVQLARINSRAASGSGIFVRLSPLARLKSRRFSACDPGAMSSWAAPSRVFSQPETDGSPTAGAAQAPSGASLAEHADDQNSDESSCSQTDPLGLVRFLKQRVRKTQTSSENVGVATPGSSRGASQAATGAFAPDAYAWEKEEERSAMHRAVEALSNALEKEECDPSRSKLRNVYLLLTSAGASHAAKAYMVVEEITRSCSERDLIKAVAREVRDILVLRCLCEMKREDHANRDVFIVTVAKAFGESFSVECRDLILHAHRKVTWGKPGAHLSKNQRRGRPRGRRVRPTAQDVQLRQEIHSAVVSFLAGEDESAAASEGDEAEAARPPAAALQM